MPNLSSISLRSCRILKVAAASVLAGIFLGAVGVGGVAAAETAPNGPPKPSQARSDTSQTEVGGLNPDCQSDNTPILQRVIDASSKAVLAPARAGLRIPDGCYAFSGLIKLTSNIEVVGSGQTTLKANGSTGALFSASGVKNVRIENLTINQQNNKFKVVAQAINISNSSDIQVLKVSVINATGAIRYSTSHDITMEDISVSDGLYHGVEFTDSFNILLRGCRMQNNRGFGVIFDGTTHNATVTGCSTTKNGIELVGATKDTYALQILNNHSEGTGDNCISVSGRDSVVQGNQVVGCAGNGIGVYGENNRIVGNTGKNNAVRSDKAGWDACIRITPQFGGTGGGNVVEGNVCDDDGAKPSQLYGVLIAASGYKLWAPNTPVAPMAYVVSHGSILQAQSAGITSNAGPESDRIKWKVIRQSTSTVGLAENNIISGNRIGRVGVAAIKDNSGSTTNVVKNNVE